MKHRNSTGGGYSFQIKRFCLILLVLIIATLFVACDDDSSSSTMYTVTFSTGDGADKVESQTIEKGSKATRPETDPTLEDKAFIGWFLAEQNNAFNFDTAITEDITIYAKWEEASSSSLQYDYVTRDGAQVTNELTVEKSSSTLRDKIYIPAKTTSKSNATVTEIKEGAFKDSYITGVYIPQSVTKIASDAFENCSSLLAIYYGGTVEQFEKAIVDGTLTVAREVTAYCSDGSKTFSKTE